MKVRSIDKLKYFIRHESKAAKLEGSTTQCFDGTENWKCYWKGIVKIAFGWMNFLMGEESLEL